ncbi:helix-turn-helix domain-containing protein [Thalassospira marina]|uniref:Helix-turn-helix domain-containing protein n=1 Tax=Thalassospira marina TaxID=2048283 RepID=A0ABM6QAG5_9PROT|nr:helix-turn-helix domain-containing protein [Thalassospira marina]AUG53558.1 helix-turn-helix domain-containing protein [Thalassospira marina]
MEPQANLNAESMTVGRLLRHTRTTHGQTLDGVAQLLRIRKVYLEAIENSDYDALPGGPYGLGFVKGYAEHLGLDGKEIVRRYKEESNAPAVRSQLSFPKPVQESRVPGGAMMLIAAVLGIVAYGGWYYLSSQGKTIADLVEPLPDRMKGYTAVPEASAPAGNASSERERTLENAAEAHAAEVGPSSSGQRMGGSPSAQASESMNDQASGTVEGMFAEPDFDATGNASTANGNANSPANMNDTPAMAANGANATNGAAPAPANGQVANNGAAGGAASAPAAPADQAAGIMPDQGNIPLPPRAPNTPQTASTPEVASVPAAPEVGDAGGGRVFGAVNADSRVTISANETSWVRIREEDGNILLTRMLSAGDVYRVPNRDGLKLEVGNAGALSISVDGAKNLVVGSYGQVISDYSLNPDDILATTTEKKTQ